MKKNFVQLLELQPKATKTISSIYIIREEQGRMSTKLKPEFLSLPMNKRENVFL